MKRGLSLLLTVLMLMLSLIGCGSKTNTDTVDSSQADNQSEVAKDEGTGETVKRLYVIPGDEPSDLERGLKNINDKLAADGIGVELELQYIAWDVWDQKLNIMLSTGEEFDMFHVMNDRVSLANYASKGALADLTGLMDEFGAAIKEANPDIAMKSGQVS